MSQRQIATTVLNVLLDRYERSAHAKGQPGRAIAIRLDPGVLPDYWDDTSSEPRQHIHHVLEELKSADLVDVRWKPHATGLEVDRVVLRLDHVDAAYRRAARISRVQMSAELRHVASRWSDQLPPWGQSFTSSLIRALDEGKALPAGLQLHDKKRLEDLLRAIAALDPAHPLPRRVFSVRVFGASKHLETNILGALRAALRAFHPLAAIVGDGHELLAEAGITGDRDHLLLAGPLRLSVAGSNLDIASLRPDVGLPASLLDAAMIHTVDARAVLTVENLTTFHLLAQGHLPDVLVVYLGGYHNAARRSFLQRVHAVNPRATFLHWGDFDFGGFQIFRFLRDRTGVPFHPFRMDIDTYRSHATMGTPFDDRYARRLARLATDPAYDVFHAVISEMLHRRRRLEQEAIDVWPLEIQTN